MAVSQTTLTSIEAAESLVALAALCEAGHSGDGALEAERALRGAVLEARTEIRVGLTPAQAAVRATALAAREHELAEASEARRSLGDGTAAAPYTERAAALRAALERLEPSERPGGTSDEEVRRSPPGSAWRQRRRRATASASRPTALLAASL
jgi:hypothetical protein